MAPPVLEILSVPVKPGVNVNDITSEAGKLAHELCLQLVDQPGCQRVYISQEVENPSIFWMLCEWESHADHMTFTKQDYYRSFVEQFSTLFDGPLSMYHAAVNPWPPNSVLSDVTPHVTEIGVGFFKPDISEAHQKEWLDIQYDHERENMRPAEGYLAHSGGWIMEEQQHPEQGPTKAYFGLWAWTSKEAHERCADREEWARVTKRIVEFPGLLDVNMVHAHFVEIQKSTASAARPKEGT